MCSAFRFFTLATDNKPLEYFCLPKVTSHDKMVYSLMIYLLELTPRALSARLVGSSSAACPRGLSPEYAHIIPQICSLVNTFRELKLQKCIFVTISQNNHIIGGVALYNINNYEPAIIAEKIKKECMRQNITVKTMLQELNLSHTAIYRMSADGVAPSYITLARICDYLNISIDALLDRAAPATPAPPNLETAVSIVAAAANLSADYVRGVLRLPPTRSSTDNDI